MGFFDKYCKFCGKKLYTTSTDKYEDKTCNTCRSDKRIPLLMKIIIDSRHLTEQELLNNITIRINKANDNFQHLNNLNTTRSYQTTSKELQPPLFNIIGYLEELITKYDIPESEVNRVLMLDPYQVSQGWIPPIPRQELLRRMQLRTPNR